MGWSKRVFQEMRQQEIEEEIENEINEYYDYLLYEELGFRRRSEPSEPEQDIYQDIYDDDIDKNQDRIRFNFNFDKLKMRRHNS